MGAPRSRRAPRSRAVAGHARSNAKPRSKPAQSRRRLHSSKTHYAMGKLARARHCTQCCRLLSGFCCFATTAWSGFRQKIDNFGFSHAVGGSTAQHPLTDGLFSDQVTTGADRPPGGQGGGLRPELAHRRRNLDNGDECARWVEQPTTSQRRILCLADRIPRFEQSRRADPDAEATNGPRRVDPDYRCCHTVLRPRAGTFRRSNRDKRSVSARVLQCTRGIEGLYANRNFTRW